MTISGGSCDQGFTPVDDLPLFIVGFDMSRKSANGGHDLGQSRLTHDRFCEAHAHPFLRFNLRLHFSHNLIYISVMYTPYGVLRKNACSHRMSASRLISDTRLSTLATGSFHRMWPCSCSVANTCNSHNGRTPSFRPLSAAFPTSSNFSWSNPPTYALILQYPSSCELFPPRELCGWFGGCGSR